MGGFSLPEILSLVALVIALTSLVVNFLLLRLQRDPDVTVVAIHDDRRPSIINLIIQNTGQGAAHDVSFSSNHPIPARAFGFENAPKPEAMSDGPLIQGIPTFAPGEKRVITWGQYGGLKSGLGDSVLDITATYYSRPALSLTRQRHKTTSRIDLRSFEGTDASDYNWDKKAAESLNELVNVLKSVADPQQRAIRINAIKPESNG
jgi:hypothetical protein